MAVPATTSTAPGCNRLGRPDAENTRPRLDRCSAHRIRPDRPHRPRSRPVLGPPLRQLASDPFHPVEGGSANDYDYTNGDPVNGLDLSGLCNEATTSCVIGILHGDETVPDGFESWLTDRSDGKASVTYYNLKGGRRALRSDGGCSAPLLGNTGGSFNFTNACKTHDLGYDLMRFFGSSGSLGSIRRAVDSNFRGDMKAHCSGRSYVLRGQCGRWANVYYFGVAANSARQFYQVP